MAAAVLEDLCTSYHIQSIYQCIYVVKEARLGVSRLANVVRVQLRDPSVSEGLVYFKPELGVVSRLEMVGGAESASLRDRWPPADGARTIRTLRAAGDARAVKRMSDMPSIDWCDANFVITILSAERSALRALREQSRSSSRVVTKDCRQRQLARADGNEAMEPVMSERESASQPLASRPKPSIELRALASESLELHMEGDLKFSDAAALWKSLTERLTTVGRGQKIDFEMSRVERIDGGTMALPPW